MVQPIRLQEMLASSRCWIVKKCVKILTLAMNLLIFLRVQFKFWMNLHQTHPFIRDITDILACTPKNLYFLRELKIGTTYYNLKQDFAIRKEGKKKSTYSNISNPPDTLLSFFSRDNRQQENCGMAYHFSYKWNSSWLLAFAKDKQKNKLSMHFTADAFPVSISKHRTFENNPSVFFLEVVNNFAGRG